MVGPGWTWLDLVGPDGPFWKSEWGHGNTWSVPNRKRQDAGSQDQRCSVATCVGSWQPRVYGTGLSDSNPLISSSQHSQARRSSPSRVMVPEYGLAPS